MISTAFAQATGSSVAGGLSPIMFNLLIFGGFFVILYFFIIRPQQRQKKQFAQMVSQLKRGDKVMLASGMFGSIVEVKPEAEEVKIEIANDVVVTFVKGAIARVIS